tara:strand:+ start:1049 stop:1792 length:744 start_codon:yes stop_codon:yes gene_type:complete
MENLRVSTITSVLKINNDIDLRKVYDNIPISIYIPFIEYGAVNSPKGFSEKLLKKKRKKKKKKIFYNQVTIHVVHGGKIMNVKLFNNGRIQITGLKKEEQAPNLVESLIEYFWEFDIFEHPVKLINNEIVLINSDFELGYEIDRETLHEEIVDYGIYSSYEACIYPGVNIKYYINTTNFENGICSCSEMCNGKGTGDGDGNCKKITIAVFKSGSIIITGGQNTNQLEECYRFIKNFIDSNKESFILK